MQLRSWREIKIAYIEGVLFTAFVAALVVLLADKSIHLGNWLSWVLIMPAVIVSLSCFVDFIGNNLKKKSLRDKKYRSINDAVGFTGALVLALTYSATIISFVIVLAVSWAIFGLLISQINKAIFEKREK